jgi:MFS family permease
VTAAPEVAVGARGGSSARSVGRRARAAVDPFLVSGPLRRMYLATLVDATGLGTYLAFSALYLTQGVGLSNQQAGLLLSLAGGASLAGIIPTGMLCDRLGGRRLLALLFAYRSAAFGGLLLAHDLVTCLVALVAAGVVSRATGPVSQSLVLGLTDSHSSGVEKLAVVRALRNAGFTLGVVPATVAVAVGTRSAYREVLILSVAAFAVAAVAVAGVPDRPVRPRRVSGRRAALLRDGRLVLLTVANGMLTLHALVLSIGFPLWLVEDTRAPRWLAATMLTINTLLVVLLQVRLSRGSEELPMARRMMVRAGLLLAAACLLVPLTSGLAGAVAAAGFVVLVGLVTLGELWHSAGSWGYLVVLAPTERRGSYLSFFSLGFTAATIVGPGLVTAMVSLRLAGWAVLAGWFLAASAIVRLIPTRPAASESMRRHDASTR